MNLNNLMNLGNIANINVRRGISYDRLERIKREGSPSYTWIVPITATTATSVIYVPTQFPTSRKYEPLDFLEIVNNEGANDLTLTINNQDSRYVPAGTIRTVSGDGVALWHLAVYNRGAVNTTLNKIVVTIRKEPMTIDKWSRR